jgi:histidinol-phosphate phosphatase family protein
VINKRIPGAYIGSIREFVFIPGALEGIASLSRVFKRVIVVTNQQGIGKGLITAEQVEDVNNFMVAEIKKYGGRIDQVYVCPDLSSDVPNCRKPNPDLAYRAKNDFPDIEFEKSIMIGDSTYDMIFGKNLGMKTVLIPTKQEEMIRYCSISVDWRISGLWEFI